MDVTIEPQINGGRTMDSKETNDNMSYISAAEAAEILGVSKRRVIKLIELKRLPAVKIGNMFALHRADVEQYAAGDRSAGRPPKAD